MKDEKLYRISTSGKLPKYSDLLYTLDFILTSENMTIENLNLIKNIKSRATISPEIFKEKAKIYVVKKTK